LTEIIPKVAAKQYFYKGILNSNLIKDELIKVVNDIRRILIEDAKHRLNRNPSVSKEGTFLNDVLKQEVEYSAAALNGTHNKESSFTASIELKKFKLKKKKGRRI